MLEFESPQKIKEKKLKIQAHGGAPYNLSQLNSIDFAHIIYWVYRTEIKTGSWSSMFDDIAIMKATRDGGRDCVLYTKGQMTGAMQCKHTTSTSSLSVDLFLKEFTKFILYSITIPEKVALIKGFKYFVVSSSVFDEGVINLMNDPSLIFKHNKFQKYTEENINGYVGLKGLEYDKISKQMQDAISLLELDRIDDSDINKLLHDTSHQSVVKAYFDVKFVLDEDTATTIKKGIKKIKEEVSKLNKVKKESVAKRPEHLPEPIPRLPREVSTPDENAMDLYNEKKVSLLDCIDKHRHIVLLGWGLSGKSVELSYAAHVLSGPDRSTHVFIFDMKFYKGEDFHKLIPKFKLRNPQDITVFLDGLDEVPFSHYRMALDSILLFKTNYPHVQIVVSCRINIYTEDENAELNTLPGFNVIKLKDLSNGTILQYLNSTPGMEIDAFDKKVYDAKLENLIHIPYYLINFVTRFINQGSIYNDKGELFEDTIELAIKKDVTRYHRENAVEKRREVTEALEQLSFVTEMQGKNIFTSQELEALFPRETRNLIIQMGQLVKGDPSVGEWSFFHHNIQEYLTAKVLSKRQFSEIQPLLVSNSSTKTIKPALINTISFLVGLVPKNSSIRKEIIALLSNSEPALLMKFEPVYLDDNFRETVFQRIFKYYKEAKRTINTLRFAIRELAGFSQTEGNANFLINEVENSTQETDLINALDILAFFTLSEFPSQASRLDQLIKARLPMCSNDIKFKMVYLLIHHNNYTEDSFQFIYEDLKSNLYTHLRAMLFTGIEKFHLGLHYRDFVKDQTLMLVEEEWKKMSSFDGSRRSGTESQKLNEIWETLDDIESVHLKLEMIRENYRVFDRSIDFKSFIKSALSQAQMYPDATYLSDIIFETYTVNIEHINIDNRRTNKWVSYFDASGKCLDACIKLISHFGGINYRIAEAIAMLCDQKCIIYLADRVSRGLIPKEEADILQWRIALLDLEMAKNFNEAVDPKIQLPFPKIVDHRERADQEFIKKASVIFSPGELSKEVEKLFQQTKKTVLTWEAIYGIASSDYSLNEYFHWLYRCIDFKSHPTRGYTLQEVLNYEALNESDLFATRVYELMKDLSMVKFNEKQISEIKNWCLLVEKTLDFSKEPIYSNNRIFRQPDEVAFVFFIRNLGLTGFKKETYLNMLSFNDGHGREEKLYELMVPFTGLTSTKSRILKNLYDKKIYGQVLLDHIAFVLKYDCKTAKTSILEYLKKDHYKWEDLLAAYLSLGGDPEPLFQLLDTSDETNLYHLFNKLRGIDPVILHSKLKSLFDNSTNLDKPKLAKYLIQLGDFDAFCYYAGVIKSAGRLPEIMSVHTTLNITYNADFAQQALELLDFVFEHPFTYSYAFSPFGVTMNILRAMASDASHYADLRMQVLNFIEQLKQKQPDAYVKKVVYLERTIEEWDHIYIQRTNSVLTFDEAIEHFKTIKGGN